MDEMDESEKERRIEEDNKETFSYNIWKHLEDEVPLYCQVDWENDIIWNPEDVNKKRSTGSRVNKEKLGE
jgi:hypothetical protein